MLSAFIVLLLHVWKVNFVHYCACNRCPSTPKKYTEVKVWKGRLFLVSKCELGEVVDVNSNVFRLCLSANQIKHLAKYESKLPPNLVEPTSKDIFEFEMKFLFFWLQKESEKPKKWKQPRLSLKERFLGKKRGRLKSYFLFEAVVREKSRSDEETKSGHKHILLIDLLSEMSIFKLTQCVITTRHINRIWMRLF